MRPKKSKVVQYDAKTAYLISLLNDNDIFIELPQEKFPSKKQSWSTFEKFIWIKANQKMLKTFFHDLLLECGLTQSQMDPRLYFNSVKTVFVLIWVDDIALFADTDQSIHLIIEQLSKSITLEKRGQLQS